MCYRRIFLALLAIAAGFAVGCKDSSALPDPPASLLEGGAYNLPTVGGSMVEGICVDADSDGVIDGFDLDSNPSVLEILIGEEDADGVYGIDVDRDGAPDCYLTVDEIGTITICTTQDGSGSSVALVIDAGRFCGIDTDGDGTADILLEELNLTFTVTTPGEPPVSVSGDGTVLGEFDQMTVTAGLSGALSWIWYLDGEIIAGATSNSYTVNCFSLGLELGVHNVTIIGTTSAGSYSNQIAFTVEN